MARFGTSDPKQLTALGVKTVYAQTYQADTTNFQSIASQLSAKKPDLIAQGAVFEDGVGLVRSLKQLNYSPKALFQTSAPSNAGQYSKGIGEANTEGVFYTVSWDQEATTPLNSDFVAAALGTDWDGKFGVNAELNLTSAPGHDSKLYRQLAKTANLAFGLGSFSQMGFVEARIATAALLNMKPPYTLRRVNNAFAGVSNFHTDILCSPWYFGKVPRHVPNNVDRTVTPKNGKMVVKEGCFKISAADPDIAKVRAIEKKNPKLTKGKPYPLQG